MAPVWRVRLFIFVLALIAAGMGYLYFTQRISPEERAAQRATPPPSSQPIATPDTTVVNPAQMIAVPYDVNLGVGASQSAVLNFIADNKPGIVILFGSKLSQTQAKDAITEVLEQNVTEEQPLIAVDHEGGLVQRLSGEGFTVLPTWKRMCTQSEEVRQESLATSAAELRAEEISIVFGPVLDVAESNNVLKDRICSGDPEVVSGAALDFIGAFQKENILPVLKHYPGLGSAAFDTHTQIGSITITEKDTTPFKNILDKYPSLGVMSAHIQVENQGLKLPCSLSVSCIGQLFELYPQVIVFSDALEMEAARYNPQNPDQPKSLETVAIEAIMAGSDVITFGKGVTPAQLEGVLSRMKQEYTRSSEFRNKVNQSVAKIENLRAEYKPITIMESEE